jgi:large subunit ribosomal protein L33
LECTEHKAIGVPGIPVIFHQTIEKISTDRLELKKYNPYLKKVPVHKEIK